MQVAGHTLRRPRAPPNARDALVFSMHSALCFSFLQRDFRIKPAPNQKGAVCDEAHQQSKNATDQYAASRGGSSLRCVRRRLVAELTLKIFHEFVLPSPLFELNFAVVVFGKKFSRG